MSPLAQLANSANVDSQTTGWRSPGSRPHNRGSMHPYNRELLQHLYAVAVEEIIKNRIDDWLDQTSWQSSITSMTRHPLFPQIVNEGMEAAQYVLRKMNAGEIRLHWFPILQDITKVDPVPPYSRGNLQEMATAWINWGRAKQVL